jgi:hypothetical protein
MVRDPWEIILTKGAGKPSDKQAWMNHPGWEWVTKFVGQRRPTGNEHSNIQKMNELVCLVSIIRGDVVCYNRMLSRICMNM